MKRRSRDEEREQRITMEIIVDAYTPEEQAMGWYYSLEDRLHFPFVARCIAERSISPLRVGDEVEVVGMAPEEECQHEMFVLIPWERRTLAVPLQDIPELLRRSVRRRQGLAWPPVSWLAPAVLAGTPRLPTCSSDSNAGKSGQASPRVAVVGEPKRREGDRQVRLALGPHHLPRS
jgi:hypothetical protein